MKKSPSLSSTSIELDILHKPNTARSAASKHAGRLLHSLAREIECNRKSCRDLAGKKTAEDLIM